MNIELITKTRMRNQYSKASIVNKLDNFCELNNGILQYGIKRNWNKLDVKCKMLWLLLILLHVQLIFLKIFDALTHWYHRNNGNKHAQ